MALKQSAGELAYRIKVGLILAALGAAGGSSAYLYWLGSTANDTTAWGLLMWGRWLVMIMSSKLSIFSQPIALSALAGVLVLIIPFFIFLTKEK